DKVLIENQGSSEEIVHRSVIEVFYHDGGKTDISQSYVNGRLISDVTLVFEGKDIVQRGALTYDEDGTESHVSQELVGTGNESYEDGYALVGGNPMTLDEYRRSLRANRSK
ncbi:MAG: hypothetical protein Q7S00_03690, partial [bacterium]|nr:hypothetical protein [bacterium]